MFRNRYYFYLLISTKIPSKSRSSCWQMFFKIGVLKKIRNIRKKTPVLESLFNKVADLKACKNCDNLHKSIPLCQIFFLRGVPSTEKTQKFTFSLFFLRKQYLTWYLTPAEIWRCSETSEKRTPTGLARYWEISATGRKFNKD